MSKKTNQRPWLVHGCSSRLVITLHNKKTSAPSLISCTASHSKSRSLNSLPHFSHPSILPPVSRGGEQPNYEDHMRGPKHWRALQPKLPNGVPVNALKVWMIHANPDVEVINFRLGVEV